MLSTRGRGTEKNKRVLASDATWGFLRANPNKLIDAGDSFGTQHLESMLPKFAEWSFTKIPQVKSFNLLYTSWRWTMSKRSGDKIHLSANQYRDICNKLDEMLHLGVTENQHTVNDIIDPPRIPAVISRQMLKFKTHKFGLIGGLTGAATWPIHPKASNWDAFEMDREFHQWKNQRNNPAKMLQCDTVWQFDTFSTFGSSWFPLQFVDLRLRDIDILDVWQHNTKCMHISFLSVENAF